MNYIITILMLVCLAGCQTGKAIQSVCTGQYNKVTVVATSGLGFEPAGFKDLKHEIEAQCPTVVLVNAHWTDDLEAIVSTQWDGKQPLVMLGHSYGAGRTVYLVQRMAAGKLHVNVLYLLDPVPPPAPKPDTTIDFTLPDNVDYAKAFLRPGFQLFVAASKPIQNTSDKYINLSVDESHNAIAADDKIQAEIITKIQTYTKPEIPVLSDIGRGIENVGKSFQPKHGDKQ